MRKQAIAVATLLPILAAVAALDGSAQAPSSSTMDRIQAHQDSALEMTLRSARKALDDAQRIVDDTSVSAAVNRTLQRAAALSVQLDVQRAALDRVFERNDARLRKVFEQLERTQRRVDELMRQQTH